MMAANHWTINGCLLHGSTANSSSAKDMIVVIVWQKTRHTLIIKKDIDHRKLQEVHGLHVFPI